MTIKGVLHLHIVEEWAASSGRFWLPWSFSLQYAMQIDLCSAGQLNAIVWKWEWVKDFPSELCKQLLHQGHGYWVGWATITSASRS
jgi:hypothetical protein